jgi:hypothetical protein
MKKQVFCLFAFLFTISAYSQNPGDTIFIPAFKYGSTTRDTLINFPNVPGLTYEKIILKYNMRCKNALISTQAAPNQGCGEWDYSCNTFIVDSTKIENDLNNHPSHIISNYSGSSFNYVTQPVFDFYNFSQTAVTLNNIVSETQYTVGTGAAAAPNFLKANERSGRSQLLYTAAELTNAGFTAGNINGILLDVSNAGGGVNFFKVGIRHSALASLASGTATTTGFTNVFNQNYNFTAGSNRLQFHTPFVWDGVSNVLIDFSFTNTVPTNPIVFNGLTTAAPMALYAKNNYALDLSAFGHAYLNPAQLSSISNELTITFWAFGNAAQMPVNNSILYGYAANINDRQLNLHLPWGDNNIYFDCGYSNGGFDRINKVATAAEQGGQWNHWAFTKNAVTGNMRIYLNGTLWFSGTGKTKPISLLTLILGKDNALANNYKGKINELTVWNEELTAGDIQSWMSKAITASHPFYANLLAYYKMDEGSGLTLNDSKFNLTSTGQNLQWTYERGYNLNRMFNETTIRPNVVFLRGTYATSTSTLVTKDSVARNPNVVQQYSITNNAAVTPFIHDAVVLVTTSNLYQATPSNVYDGDTGTLTGTVAVTPTGNINITSLPYYKRYPFYNEIQSFVTPYGKGLDLGVSGKTWYYDVTDFTPLLRGPKRLLMTMGGENQEQMDLDFWFIVGTPPQNVLEFNQLWQGGARLGGVGISSINNDSRFTTLSVPLLGNAQRFKLRSTITGHGQHGEFSQNGGQITHAFNVGGGAPQFSWFVTENCTRNVIFPQGGTWVYNRQGWCPGQTSLLSQFDLTPLVTPGTTVTMDYNCSNPPVFNGDYRFIVANQVISYGGPNHATDACVVDVPAPTNRVFYSRKNAVCANPVILVRNTGSLNLTSLDIEYWLNNTSAKQTFTWTGSLAYLDTISIALPTGSLWQNGVLPANNRFHVELKKANGVVDDYAFNNVFTSPFTLADVMPQDFSIEFKTNNYYSDNNYTLVDEFGNIMGSSNFSAPNTIYTDPYFLSGCFTLIVEDYGGDGLAWWANAAQGTGYVRIRDNMTNTIVKTFQPDFGGGFVYNFSTIAPITVGANANALAAALNLYPNPTHHKFILEGTELEDAEIVVHDVLGRTVSMPSVKKNNGLEFNTASAKPGVYFLTITKEGNTATKKVVVN